MHQSVLLKEIIEYLDPQPNQNFVDATSGLGGHTFELLKYIKPKGKVLAIDWHQAFTTALEEKAKEKGYNKRLIIHCGNFKEIDSIVEAYQFEITGGILFDLGLNTDLLEHSGLGFSFLKDEPLDMRFNQDQELTAYEIVNFWPEKEIIRLLKNYGQEKFSFRIAKNIIASRQKSKIKTTQQLVQIILKSIPSKFKKSHLHPATRTFQALRIAVNDELINLEEAIPKALSAMIKGSRIAIISYHSLEDRIAKQTFRQFQKEGVCQILTPKPICPTPEEIMVNPRARSAKLRVAQKL